MVKQEKIFEKSHKMIGQKDTQKTENHVITYDKFSDDVCRIYNLNKAGTFIIETNKGIIGKSD